MRPIAWQTSARLQIPASPAFRAETTERPPRWGRGASAPPRALGTGADERPVTRWAPGAARPRRAQPRGSWARACAIPPSRRPRARHGTRAHAWGYPPPAVTRTPCSPGVMVISPTSLVHRNLAPLFSTTSTHGDRDAHTSFPPPRSQSRPRDPTRQATRCRRIPLSRDARF